MVWSSLLIVKMAVFGEPVMGGQKSSDCFSRHMSVIRVSGFIVTLQQELAGKKEQKEVGIDGLLTSVLHHQGGKAQNFQLRQFHSSRSVLVSTGLCPGEMGNPPGRVQRFCVLMKSRGGGTTWFLIGEGCKRSNRCVEWKMGGQTPTIQQGWGRKKVGGSRSVKRERKRQNCGGGG